MCPCCTVISSIVSGAGGLVVGIILGMVFKDSIVGVFNKTE